MKSERERTDAIRRLFAQLPTEDQVYRFWSEEFMLPVEGAKLRTCGWFPETEEPVPVIVTRSCYPHQEAEFRVYGEE